MPITVQCLEKNKKNNPYLIQIITFSKESNDYYAAFKCQDKASYKSFFSHVKIMLMNQRADNNQLDFLLIEPEDENTLVVRGNISKAINLFIQEKILKGKDAILFKDEEEEEIQDFLRETTRMPPYEGERTAKVIINKEENLNNPKEVAKCTIL